MTLLPTLFSRRSETSPLDVWDNMNRMMSQMFRRFPEMDIDGISSFPLDVEETKDSYIVEADMPHVNRKEVEVFLDNRVLTINVSREKETEKKERNFLLQERSCSSASRSIELPLADERQSVDATLKDGVLHIQIKKAAKDTAHKIEIK